MVLEYILIGIGSGRYYILLLNRSYQLKFQQNHVLIVISIVYKLKATKLCTGPKGSKRNNLIMKALVGFILPFITSL